MTLSSAANVAPALALYDQLEDELDADGETIGFEAQADEPPTGDHLWLHADESAEPEHVITFALRCAEALNLTGFIQSGAVKPFQRGLADLCP